MIDVLEKIDKLRKERKWSVYKLADEAGITQSTLANMFTRKTQPSIKTLEQICYAFKISLAEFFAEKEDEKNSIEKINLINSYNKLSDRDKEIINTLIKKMIE